MPRIEVGNTIIQNNRKGTFTIYEKDRNKRIFVIAEDFGFQAIAEVNDLINAYGESDTWYYECKYNSRICNAKTGKFSNPHFRIVSDDVLKAIVDPPAKKAVSDAAKRINKAAKASASYGERMGIDDSPDPVQFAQSLQKNKPFYDKLAKGVLSETAEVTVMVEKPLTFSQRDVSDIVDALEFFENTADASLEEYQRVYHLRLRLLDLL